MRAGHANGPAGQDGSRDSCPKGRPPSLKPFREWEKPCLSQARAVLRAAFAHPPVQPRAASTRYSPDTASVAGGRLGVRVSRQGGNRHHRSRMRMPRSVSRNPRIALYSPGLSAYQPTRASRPSMAARAAARSRSAHGPRAVAPPRYSPDGAPSSSSKPRWESRSEMAAAHHDRGTGPAPHHPASRAAHMSGGRAPVGLAGKGSAIAGS